MIDTPGTLYLLHFTSPLGDPGRPRMSARHYLGWCLEDELERRLHEHRTARGARITRAAVNRGIGLLLADTTPGTPRDERRRKRRGHHAETCPLCRPGGA